MGATPERRPNVGRVAELRVADEPAAWAAAGFTVADHVVRLGAVAVRLTGRGVDGARGITGWTLSGLTIPDGTLDGLPTETAPVSDSEGADAEPEEGPSHPNGATGIDHVVVATPDLERTIAACEAAGLELRRIREAASSGTPIRQAFFKLGPLVLEVVSGDIGSGVPAAESPATFFGLAVDIDDLDRAAAVLGEGLGRIKPAVQRGRRIATLRRRHFDVSVAIAAMDHHGDRTAAEGGR
ncbi:MAG: Glyoxalase/bleomycin resistance protein/dioxygenase [Ilumatobacteraceae bacterium]|nr:Glyoxalase/bleomycin resistance protein/dioxygenase [Ilumatobacteraceae bacterium]